MPFVNRPGARIWWDVQGEGSPLLLIQGLGYPALASWRIIPDLAEDHTVITMDNRGAGQSDVPTSGFTIGDLAEDAAAVIEAVGLGPVHVKGMSMGGLVAQELTLRYPHLVRTLIIGCSSPGGPHAIPMDMETGKKFLEWGSMPARDAALSASEIVYGPNTPKDRKLEDIEKRMTQPTQRKGYNFQLAAVGHYQGSLKRLDEVKQPVLVIHGDRDVVVPPENVQVTLQGIPHAQVALLPGAGHVYTTDATEDTVALMKNFLAGHDSDPAPRTHIHVDSTMQDDYALTIPAILRHAQTLHGEVELIDASTPDAVRRVPYSELIERIHRLTGALQQAGVRGGERVGSFMWNTQAHVEAYFGVPASGGVLHTINIRLFPDQVAWIINDAHDEILLVDASLWDSLASVWERVDSVRLVVVDGELDLDAAAEQCGREVISYEDFVGSAEPVVGDVLDERAPAVMCYTSGTTGDPKGVVYSHRTVYLHAMVNLTSAGFGIGDRDTIIQIVALFHANGWGFPYAALMGGARLLLPFKNMHPEILTPLIHEHRPTVAGGVPTVWRGVYDYAMEHDLDITSLRVISCSGSAVPDQLLRDYVGLGIEMYQAWGMTESSPLAAIARPPAEPRDKDEWYWRTRTGRPMPGIELRVVGEDGTVLPGDGETVGEVEIRGAWVARGYVFGRGEEKFHDGWLRTGDVGKIDPAGALKLTDRLKDLIKSGGEWISSAELEGILVEHPAVEDAAVIGIPDPKWEERPMGVITVKEGATVTEEELREHLMAKIAKWQVPDRWKFVEAIPRTGVGKINKIQLREEAREDLGGQS